MLTVSNISKRFPGEENFLFDNVSFTVNGGERVGLFGRNGCGKTTLLRIITGEIQPDRGSVQFQPPNLRVGYLAQGLEVADDVPISSLVYPQSAFQERVEADFERISTAMTGASDNELDALLIEYGEVLDKMAQLDEASNSVKAERILQDLDLGQFDLSVPVGMLSGGQKTRLGLAAILINDPDLLILDEPTNHLDITALEWLEDWLQTFQGGVLMVSHDRTFLDEMVNRIVAFDEETGNARVFEGTYSDYAGAIRHERDNQWAQWRDQQVEIARLQSDVRRTMARAIRKENATKDDRQRRYAKKVAKRAKAKETRLMRYLDSEDRVEKPGQTWNLKLDFDALPTTGRDVVSLEAVSVGYDFPLLEDLTLSVRAGERIAVLGPNGQGKSTLLKTIIGELEPLSGHVRLGASVEIGYLAQDQDILDPDKNPLEMLAEASTLSHTEARSFLHFYLFSGDDVFRKCADLSFGERARLMLAMLVIKGSNLLVLDEPINHLDASSRELFEEALSHFKGSVLAVVHDRYFVDRFASAIWQVENGGVRQEFRRPDFVA